MPNTLRQNYRVELSPARLEKLTTMPWYLPDLGAATVDGKPLPTLELIFGDLDRLWASGLTAKPFAIGSPQKNLYSQSEGFLTGGRGSDFFLNLQDGSTVAGGEGADEFVAAFVTTNNSLLHIKILDLEKIDTLNVYFADPADVTEKNINAIKDKYGKLCNLKFQFEVNMNFSGQSFDDDISAAQADRGVKIDGLDGNDHIVGGEYRDTLVGGAGNDTIYGTGGYDPVTDRLGDILYGGAGADTIYLFAGDILMDSDANDTIIVTRTDIDVKNLKGKIIYECVVTEDRVRFSGGQYADTLHSFGKGVTLFGGAGVDTFNVDDADDRIGDLQAGEHVIIDNYNAALLANARAWEGKGADVTFALNLQSLTIAPTIVELLNGDDYVNVGASGSLVRAGGGKDTVLGNEGKDTLYGDAGNDLIDGLTGNDALYGGDGHDTLVGVDGDDVLWGENGNDILNGGGGNDLLRGHTGNDTLNGGNGNDTLSGGEGSDLLIGGDGHDRMAGDQGDDTIVASQGNDVITGDYGPGDQSQRPRGKDVFVFNVTNKAYLTTITDFTSGEDKIDLSGFTMAGLSVAQIRKVVNFNKGMLTADFNGDGLLDVNVKLQAGARFNLATDLIVNPL